MLTIKVTGLDKVRARLGALGKQVPFATARALNATAEAVVAAEAGVMRAVFDRPTPFTVGSLRVDRAEKSRLAAWVVPKDTPDGRSADRWLAPEVVGGPRRLKGVERSMQAAGILPAGMAVVPAAGAKIDAYGNWSRADINRVLTAMRLAGTAVAARRIGKLQAKGRGKASSRYFVVQQQQGELEPGIYERKGTRFGVGVRPVALFRPGLPIYRRRFPFDEVAQRVARRELQPAFDRELAAALASAR